MKRFVRDNGLTLFFLAIFLAALLGQAAGGPACSRSRCSS
jgi:hypothetical protein